MFWVLIKACNGPDGFKSDEINARGTSILSRKNLQREIQNDSLTSGILTHCLFESCRVEWICSIDVFREYSS